MTALRFCAGMAAPRCASRSEEHRQVDLIDRGVELVQRLGAWAVAIGDAVVSDVAKITVFETDPAYVPGDRAALEYPPPVGQEGIGGLQSECVVGRGGKILVARFEVLRGREWEQVA